MVCQILKSDPLRSGANLSGVPQGIDTLLGIAKLPEELLRILSKLGSRVVWSLLFTFDRGIKGAVVSIIFQGDGLNSSFITDKRIFKGCLKIMDRSSRDLPGKDFEPVRGVLFLQDSIQHFTNGFSMFESPFEILETIIPRPVFAFQGFT